MRSALALVLVVALPVTTAAQDPQAVKTETFVPIAPIVRRNPDYPQQAQNFGNEGWVMLSFVVSEAGEVQEPMIEDSSGVEAFEHAALDAIRRWRYTPATVNGEPVAQSMVKTRITFSLEGPARGVTREFRDKHVEIRRLLDAGDYAAAGPLIEQIEFGGRKNLYEDALFWALKYGYLEGVQSTDTAEKQRALQLALGHQADHLPSDMLVALMQRLYVLQVQAIDLSAARSTLDRLRNSESASESSQTSCAVRSRWPT
jgi:TonB family protein